MRHPESEQQKYVIQWARAEAQYRPLKYPFLWMLHCSLNGVLLSETQARCAKAQGLLRGVYDLFLPVPRGGFYGLYIEMKHGTNKLTPEQKEYGIAVQTLGYKAVVCYSANDAIKEIEAYYANS